MVTVVTALLVIFSDNLAIGNRNEQNRLMEESMYAQQGMCQLHNSVALAESSSICYDSVQ